MNIPFEWRSTWLTNACTLSDLIHESTFPFKIPKEREAICWFETIQWRKLPLSLHQKFLDHFPKNQSTWKQWFYGVIFAKTKLHFSKAPSVLWIGVVFEMNFSQLLCSPPPKILSDTNLCSNCALLSLGGGGSYGVENRKFLPRNLQIVRFSWC